MSFYGTGHEFEMLQDALEAGGIAWWLMEYPTGTVFFSANKIKMLGYTEAEADKFIHFSHFTEMIHPDDYEGAMVSMRNLLTGVSDLYETRYRIRTKSGGYIVYYDKGRIVGRNKKGELAVAGVVINITENEPDESGLPVAPATATPAK